MEIFTILGVAWACLLILKIIGERADTNQRMEMVKQEADRRIRIVSLEQVPDQKLILAYDIENNQFLGQGADVEEVKASIMERFPEKIFVLGDKVFTALKGNVEVKFEKSTTS